MTSAQDDEGTVIPLQFLGVSDEDQEGISLDEHMKFALPNMEDKEGSYVVRHGLQPLSEFGQTRGNDKPPRQNPLAAAYPLLFPYGIGGIESCRQRTIGFDEHIRWALQYYDGWF